VQSKGFLSIVCLARTLVQCKLALAHSFGKMLPFMTSSTFARFSAAVKKAWETLNNEKDRNECLGVVEDAKNRLEAKLKSKRKKLKKEGKPTDIPEDDTEIVRKSRLRLLLMITIGQ